MNSKGSDLDPFLRYLTPNHTDKNWRGMKMGEIIIGILLIILSVVIYTQAGVFPPTSEAQLNAGSFPSAIALLLALLSLILIISNLIKLIRKKSELKKMDRKTYLKSLYPEYKYVLFTLASLFVYILLMQVIGFIITTILFIVITGIVLGPKTKKDIVIISVIALVVTLTTYTFFENVLHVRFPSGLFF
jgi:putative tricarboxylic transport membrane protein